MLSHHIGKLRQNLESYLWNLNPVEWWLDCKQILIKHTQQYLSFIEGMTFGIRWLRGWCLDYTKISLTPLKTVDLGSVTSKLVWFFRALISRWFWTHCCRFGFFNYLHEKGIIYSESWNGLFSALLALIKYNLRMLFPLLQLLNKCLISGLEGLEGLRAILA